MWKLIELPGLMRTNRLEVLKLLDNLDKQIELYHKDNNLQEKFIEIWADYKLFVKELIDAQAPILGDYEPWDRGDFLFLKDEFKAWLSSKINSEKKAKMYVSNLEQAIKFIDEENEKVPLFDLVNLGDYIHTNREYALVFLTGIKRVIELENNWWSGKTPKDILTFKYARISYKYYKDFITNLIQSNSFLLGIYTPEHKEDSAVGYRDMTNIHNDICLYNNFML